MAGETFSVSAQLRDASRRLQTLSDTARLDAELLLCKALDCTRSYLYAHGDQVLTTEQHNAFINLLNQRIDGMPVAYLSGQQEFWSLQLEVNPSVLVPRADTEHLVEIALQLIAKQRGAQVLDLGTGSGAIALALATERSDIQVTAVDRSQAALKVARSNVKKIGSSNIQCVESNWFSNLRDQRFDLVVSNPPYIPARDPHLDSTGVRFEPQSALVAGEDGLDDIRRISKNAVAHLVPQGHLLLEHGYDQGQSVRNQLMGDGYTQVITSQDATGNDRVTYGTREFPH